MSKYTKYDAVHSPKHPAARVAARMQGVELAFAGRPVLSVDRLLLYEGDRVGVVGLNGSGKTTLLRVLTGALRPDRGTAEILVPFAQVEQLPDLPADDDGAAAHGGRFSAAAAERGTMSGGERERVRIERALQAVAARAGRGTLLIADEPSSNLDADAAEKLLESLRAYKGTLLLVSHDRELLDETCTAILEVENGRVRLYPGNYTKYRALKEAEHERQQFEYDQYRAEKRRLEQAEREKAQAAHTMKKAPARMGNSEARLHKLGNQRARQAVESGVKSIRSRIGQLEAKERPDEIPQVKIDLAGQDSPGARVLCSAAGLTLAYGDKVLLADVSFEIFRGGRTLIAGPNGCGKTTLLERLYRGSGAVRWAPGCSIGYFRQDLRLPDPSRTLLEAVLGGSRLNETAVRTLLSRMHFRREDLATPAGALSGGEQVKAALCRIVAGGYNVLMLDEPTNYLDVFSMEALEESLADYDGTVVFVTHDRRFSRLADRMLLFEQGRLTAFDGGPEALAEHRRRSAQKDEREELLLLETRLSVVLSRLSAPGKKDDVEALDREYRKLAAQIRRLRG